MRKILLIGWKDLKLSFRDRTALILTLAAPFLLIIGLGFVSGRMSGNSGGIQGIPVVLVNLDGEQLGNGLAQPSLVVGFAYSRVRTHNMAEQH